MKKGGCLFCLVAVIGGYGYRTSLRKRKIARVLYKRHNEIPLKFYLHKNGPRVAFHNKLLRLVLINVVSIDVSLCENKVFEFHQGASETLIDENTEQTTAELIAHTHQQPPMLQRTHPRKLLLLIASECR